VLHAVLWINVAPSGSACAVGVLAFAANLFCLMVLWRRRDIVIGLLVASVFGRWAVQVPRRIACRRPVTVRQ